MGNLVSPVEGNVWKINVAVGDEVEVDDEIIIIEALKMEIPIYSVKAGKVVKIEVKDGESVREDQVLVVIE